MTAPKPLKHFPSIVALALLLTLSARGQTQSPSQSAPPLAPATLVGTAPYAIVAQDANSRTWQSTATYTDNQGNLSYKTNSFQTIATGLTD